MIFKDLRYKHINKDFKGGALYVSFSAWNSNGMAHYFGENFFLKNEIETFLVAQNGINHWWHTEEINSLAEIVKDRARETGKYIVLYGSSMGGYAACHFRKLFNSSFSIAIAPQIFVDKSLFTEEKRWNNELLALQSSLRFNEISNLQQQLKYPLYVFSDSIHEMDSKYIDYYKEQINVSESVSFIDVPYSNHDVARGLNQAKILTNIVLSFNNKSTVLSTEVLNSLTATAYLYDFKSFLNCFRRLDFINNTDQVNQLMGYFEEYYSQKEKMDFEALYFLAEALMKLGRYREAIDVSLESIELYIYKYSRPAPEYLRNKFKYIVLKALN